MPKSPRFPSVPFWLTLAFGLVVAGFAFSKPASAALVSPSSVATGTGYGQQDNLGQRKDAGGTEEETSWRETLQKNQKLVTLNPTGNQPLMVAAFINKQGCTATPVCHLEFKVSQDKGLTWRQALEGSQQWLPALGPKFDYTLYVDPGDQDIWVAYVTATVTHDTVTYTKAKIRKLVWDATSKVNWSLGFEREVQCSTGTDCAHPGADFSGQVAVGVQSIPGGVRVWTVAAYWVLADSKRYYSTFANDAFDSGNTWTEHGTFGSVYANPGFAPAGAGFRSAFIPVGTQRTPAIIYSKPEREYKKIGGSCATDPGTDPTLQVLTVADGTTWSSGISFGRHPYYQANYFGGGNCSATADQPMDYAFAAAPLSATSSRVVAAVEGGTDATHASFQGQVLLQNCTITIGSAPTCSVGVTHTIAFAGIRSPAVIFSGTHADGSPRARLLVQAGGSFKLYSENLQPPAIPPWNWAENALPAETPIPDNATTGSVLALAAVMNVPSGFTLNSGLPPILWSPSGGNRMAFSANMGGTPIAGTKTADPVMGFGWSPNFGFLSLNCGSIPSGSCDPVAYGVGVGIAASGSPPSRAFAPSSDTSTFPLGGYAWGDLYHAGALSFERSVNITATNPNGNPPGQAYYVGAGAGDPIAMYDRTSQKLYGWARFLNLCGYNAGTQHCTNDTDGWVRLQGFWQDQSATTYSPLGSDFTHTMAPPQKLQFFVGTSHFGSNVGSNGIGIIGNEYFSYTKSGAFLTVSSDSGQTLQRDYLAGTTVYNATKIVDGTNQSYGVVGYWTGDHYELSGWAWSQEYGWIRFNPLIFIGYAWLETLFGNVYSTIGIQLPNPEDITGARLETCGTTGTDPCYVSTYRIETGGTISPLTQPNGQALAKPGSAVDYLTNGFAGKSGQKLPTCGSATASGTACTPVYGIQPSDVLPYYQRDQTTAANLFTFPSVSPNAITYRNALGSLDVGDLTKMTVTPIKILNATIECNVTYGPNRNGSTVYETQKVGGNPQDWTLRQLNGLQPTAQCGILPTMPLNTFRSQVVHVQGSLDIDGVETTFTSINRGDGTNGTIDLGSASGFPVNATCADTANHPSSCVVEVIGPGSTDDEYFSYTGVSGNQLTGVKSLTGGSITHTGTAMVRWVWSLPYKAGEASAQTTTVVVDGDLKIHYNIITQIPSSPAKIRDVPTLAFVVKGNTIIDPKVSKVTAALVDVSRDSSVAADTVSGTDILASAACSVAGYTGCGGVIATGYDNATSLCAANQKCRPLTILGLVFARTFGLQRIGSTNSISTPAETITSDQNLFLNPPPGLSDLTQALPNPQRTLP